MDCSSSSIARFDRKRGAAGSASPIGMWRYQHALFVGSVWILAVLSEGNGEIEARELSRDDEADTNDLRPSRKFDTKRAF